MQQYANKGIEFGILYDISCVLDKHIKVCMRHKTKICGMAYLIALIHSLPSTEIICPMMFY